MKPTSFEDVLEQVGSNGRHQNLLVWLYVLPINFLIPWMVLTPIFLSSTPSHHCAPPSVPMFPQGRVPAGDRFPGSILTHPNAVTEGNYTAEMWTAVALPRKDGKTEQCRQYNISWADLESYESWSAERNLSQHIIENFDEINCAHGHTYDQSDFDETLPTALGWVCDKEHYTAMWLSVGLAGNVIGTFVFTSLADIFGRRPLLALTALVCAVFGSARIYAMQTWTAMLAQFLASLSFPAMLELSLIIILEQVSAAKRSFITSASFVMWTLGMCLLPLIAWLARSWKLLSLITSLPFLLFAAGYWILPESPSWLLSRGRVSETVQLLKTIARRNNMPVPKDVEEQVSMLCGRGKQHHGPLQLLYTPTVRKRTLLLTACYTCNNLFYYGLTYNIDNMSGNQFLNFFLFGITELPANFLGGWMVEVLGRRWSQTSCFLAASVCALASMSFLDQDQSVWGTTALLTISKLFVTISFLVIYIQCAEIYPTSHRGSGTGLSSLVSSCFGTTAPYIAVVSKFWTGLPYLILAGIGTLGMVVSSFLPETLGQDLPQTLDDAEYFLTEESFFSFKGRNPCMTRVNFSAKSEEGNTSPLRQRASDRAAADVSTIEALNSSKNRLGKTDDNLFSSTQVILANGEDFSETPDDV